VSGGGDDDGVEQVAAVQGRRLMAVSGTDAQAGGSAGITTAVHSTSSGSGHTSLGSRLRRLLDSVTAPDGNTVGADNEAVAPATSSPARHDDIATSSRTSHEQKQQAQGSKELKLQGVPATAGSHTQPVAASSGAGAAADLNTLVASKEGAATVAASPPPASPPPPPELRPYGSMGEGGPVRPKPFVFVSTFKWEMRKGWDSLLAAYLQVRQQVGRATRREAGSGQYAACRAGWITTTVSSHNVHANRGFVKHLSKGSGCCKGCWLLMAACDPYSYARGLA
jgi:hypothetical protein